MHRTESAKVQNDATITPKIQSSADNSQATKTDPALNMQMQPKHTYHGNSGTSTSVQMNSVKPSEQKPEFTDEEMKSWIDSLTVESVQRAVAAAETAGYDQVEIQLVAKKMALQQDSVPIVHVQNDNRPYIEVSVNKNVCYPLLDSGAMVCVMSYIHEDELSKYNTEIRPCSMTVTTVTKAEHQVTGVMWLRYEIGDRFAYIPTITMRSHRPYFIVGINFFKAFNIQLSWGDACTCAPMAMPWNNEGPAPLNQYVPPPLEKAVESHTCSHVKPIQDKDHISVSVSDNDENIKKCPEQVTNAHIGMISLANRLTSCQLNRLRIGLKRNSPIYANPLSKQEAMATKFDDVRLGVNKITNSLFHRNAYTQYETGTDTDECAWLKNPDATDNQAPTDVSVAEFALELLKGMPTPRVSIAEIAIQPAITTAEDNEDTAVDTLPQKHCCVSEPHVLTSEQQKKLDEVLKMFPYTSDTGPLNCTHVYTQRINTGDALPEMRKQYQMSPYVLAEVEKEIAKLVERNIIEPIDFSAWRWPILWVRKKMEAAEFALMRAD